MGIEADENKTKTGWPFKKTQIAEKVKENKSSSCSPIMKAVSS